MGGEQRARSVRNPWSLLVACSCIRGGLPAASESRRVSRPDGRTAARVKNHGLDPIPCARQHRFSIAQDWQPEVGNHVRLVPVQPMIRLFRDKLLSSPPRSSDQQLSPRPRRRSLGETVRDSCCSQGISAHGESLPGRSRSTLEFERSASSRQARQVISNEISASWKESILHSSRISGSASRVHYFFCWAKMQRTHLSPEQHQRLYSEKSSGRHSRS